MKLEFEGKRQMAASTLREWKVGGRLRLPTSLSSGRKGQWSLNDFQRSRNDADWQIRKAPTAAASAHGSKFELFLSIKRNAIP